MLRTPALDQRPSGGGVRSQSGRAPRPGVRALPSGVFGPTYPRRGRAYTAAKRGDDGSARWSRPRRSAGGRGGCERGQKRRQPRSARSHSTQGTHTGGAYGSHPCRMERCCLWSPAAPDAGAPGPLVRARVQRRLTVQTTSSASTTRVKPLAGWCDSETYTARYRRRARTTALAQDRPRADAAIQHVTLDTTLQNRRVSPERSDDAPGGSPSGLLPGVARGCSG